MAFGQPDAGGDKLDYNAIGPALLLFAVRSLEENIMTSYGTSDALKVDVAVLTGPKAGELLHSSLIFPKVLVSSLRKYAGQPYPENLALGTLGQGAAKPGQSPAWTLNPYTQQDDAIAQQWLAAHPEFGKVSAGQPSSTQQTASSGVWGGQATAGSGWGGQAEPQSGGWGAPPATVPFPGHNIAPEKAAEFISHGVTAAHLDAVKHIPGYESVPAAALKAKAEELLAAQTDRGAWGEPPF